MESSNQKLVIALMIGMTTGVVATICLKSLLPDFEYSARMFLVDCSSSSGKGPTTEAQAGDYVSSVRPSQIDRSMHMNNSMYLYELNFSRRQYFNDIGMWRLLKELNANMVIQAQTIRYRRELRMGQKYKIVTRLVQFSEKDSCFYLESRFVMPDDFVAAVHHVKYRVVGPKGNNGKPVRVSPLALLVAAQVLPGDYHGPMALDQHPLSSPDSNCGDADADMNFVGLWEAANALSSRALNPHNRL